jgi:hypothetical protein
MWKQGRWCAVLITQRKQGKKAKPKEVCIVKKSVIFIILTIVLWFAYSTTAYAWLYYSKPEFRGRVIDAETKQPIEGTVVVVLYEKWEFGGPGGGNTLPMDAKETLTDKNGEFNFPSYRTLIGPLSRENDVSFIIYKPGYMSLDGMGIISFPDEKYFSSKKDMIGKEGTIKYVETRYGYPKTVIWKGLMGIVELKKPKTREDFLQGSPGAPSPDYRSNRLPLLFKAINEDRKNRGWEDEIK